MRPIAQRWRDRAARLVHRHAPANVRGRQLDLAEDQVDQPVQQVRLAWDVVIQRHGLDPDSLAELAHAE
jgi:hypothetical protein